MFTHEPSLWLGGPLSKLNRVLVNGCDVSCGTHHVIKWTRPSARISYCKRWTCKAWEGNSFIQHYFYICVLSLFQEKFETERCDRQRMSNEKLHCESEIASVWQEQERYKHQVFINLLTRQGTGTSAAGPAMVGLFWWSNLITPALCLIRILFSNGTRVKLRQVTIDWFKIYV